MKFETIEIASRSFLRNRHSCFLQHLELWARRQFSPPAARMSVPGLRTTDHQPRPRKLKSLPRFTDGQFRSAHTKVIAASAFGGSDPNMTNAAQSTNVSFEKSCYCHSCRNVRARGRLPITSQVWEGGSFHDGQSTRDPT